MQSLLLRKLSIFLSLAAIIFLWEFWFFNPCWIVEIGLLSIIIVFFETWLVTWRPVAVESIKNQLHKSEFWRFAILPVALIISSFLLETIWENIWYDRGVLLVVIIGLLLVFYNLFSRFNNAKSYDPASFESLSNYVNLVSFFFLQIDLFAFAIFLDQPWYLSFGINLIFSSFLTYQVFWLSGVRLVDGGLHLMIVLLILSECFWALAILPISFYVAATVLSVIYYLLINISRNFLVGLLNQKMIQRYVVIGIIMVVLVLMTAQWK